MLTGIAKSNDGEKAMSRVRVRVRVSTRMKQHACAPAHVRVLACEQGTRPTMICALRKRLTVNIEPCLLSRQGTSEVHTCSMRNMRASK
jgi:hypothetical protein